MKAIKQILLIVCVSILTYVAVMTLGSAYKANMARAHSDGHQLYDADCCNQIDCAPVDKVEMVPTGRMHAGMSLLPTAKLPTTTVITTKHGTVAIPEDFGGKARRQSRDGRMHACLRNTASGIKLICLYEPPGI
jgi:hypothetical protein